MPGYAVLIAAVAAAIGVICIAVIVPVLYDLIRFKRGIYAIDLGSVAGYADKYSFKQGEPIDLYIHSDQPVTLTKLRLAERWEHVGEESKIDNQEQDNRYDRTRGLRWTKSATVDSSNLVPGLYQFLLQQESNREAQFSIPIIIKDGRPNRLSVILTTNTWDAYNTFGGISHYENSYVHGLSRVFSKVVKRPNWDSATVPSRRPNSLFSNEVGAADFGAAYSSFLVRNELEFLAFLARNAYDFGVYGDRDLADDPIVRQANALLFPGHSEYWTDGMFYSFERFLLRGGKVFRSVSGMEGKAAFTPLGLTFAPRPADSIANELVGAHMDADGSFTAAPFRALCPDHWVFTGTGLQSGDLFGEDSANRPSFDVPGHQHLRGTIDLEGQPQNGASGFFTSKVGQGSGRFSILAIGTNPRGPAHMVYRDLPGGGWVFNASSLSFNGALFRDEVVARIVRNLMDDALDGRLSTQGNGTWAEVAGSMN